MSSSIKSWMISGGSLVAGMACVAAIWWLIPKEDATVVQNKLRFEQLSGQEQADIRNKAKAFVDSTNEPELTRLQQIHGAVEANPVLLTRLKTLDGLLVNLNADAKAKLNPDGEFASDWAQQIQTLAQDKNTGDVKYVFPFWVLTGSWRTSTPSVVINGHQYETFLDQASAEDWGSNEEYQDFISRPDRITRRMFKTLALLERSIQDESGELNSSIIALARQMLVSKGPEREERGRPPELSLGSAGSKDRDSEREKFRTKLKPIYEKRRAIQILEVGLKNIQKNFLSRYAADKTVVPKVFTESFKRAEQIQLMTMAPADANQELKARLVEGNDAQDPEITRINEILADTKTRRAKHLNELMRGLRDSWNDGSGRGRPRSTGGGLRPDGTRGPDERGTSERGTPGRGPGGRGGRGPSGPRPEGARGLGGGSRRSLENRGDGKHQRDRQPTNPSSDLPESDEK